MTKRRHVDRTTPTFLDRVQYAALRGLVGSIRLLPLGAAYALGRGVGRLLHRLDRRHREVALENLRAAFPEKSEAERRAIALGAFQSFALVAVEMAILGKRLDPHHWREHVEPRNFALVERIVESGRGCVFMTGHFGNWEVLGASMALAGIPFHSVARPIDNPLADRFFVRLREQFGQKIVRKRGALREMVRVLREGGYLGLLADQDARGRGLFVEFFGRPASTEPAPAVLAVKLGVPMLVGFCHRTGRFRFVAEAAAVLEPDPAADRDAEVRRLTQEYTACVEAVIRRHPEQWLWLHRRWKTRPSAVEKIS
jgi:KDO2-lipid IV(A) lauroyltransferase